MSAAYSAPWWRKIWSSLQWMGGCGGIALITVLLWCAKITEGIWLTAFLAMAGYMYAGRNASKYIAGKAGAAPGLTDLPLPKP